MVVHHDLSYLKPQNLILAASYVCALNALYVHISRLDVVEAAEGPALVTRCCSCVRAAHVSLYILF